MSARSLTTIALLKALEGPIDATILQEAKARLEELPDSWLTPHIVSKIYNAALKNDTTASHSSTQEWLEQWLKKNKTIRATQAMLEVNPSAQVLAIAEELLQREPPDPATRFLVAPLLANKSDRSAIFHAEQWLGDNCFWPEAEEVLTLLLRHGNEIQKESYLNALASHKNNYGIFVALLRYRLSAKAVRAAKRFIKLHPGTYQSAVVLAALIKTRRLKQEKKWINLWLQAQSYQPAGYFVEVLEACFTRKKPAKYALSLTKWLAGTVQPAGAYPFKILLKRKDARAMRILLIDWLHENLASKKAHLHLLTLIKDGCDAQAVSLAKQWLVGKTAKERESVLEELISRGCHEPELIAMANENLRELPDSPFSLFLAEELIAYAPEKYSSFIKDGLKDGHFKDMFDLFIATRAIYKVRPDEELLAEFNKCLEIIPYFHKTDRRDLSHWLATVYKILMEITPSPKRREEIEAWVKPGTNLSAPARRSLKKLLQIQ